MGTARGMQYRHARQRLTQHTKGEAFRRPSPDTHPAQQQQGTVGGPIYLKPHKALAAVYWECGGRVFERERVSEASAEVRGAW